MLIKKKKEKKGVQKRRSRDTWRAENGRMPWRSQFYTGINFHRARTSAVAIEALKSAASIPVAFRFRIRKAISAQHLVIRANSIGFLPIGSIGV